MIDEIQVENLALIREATLVPARGLTVLTGETGAGKTALLSALKLLMGARADKDAVRDGEEALSVSGRFYGAVFSGFASSDDLAGRSSADAVESGEADDGVPVELVAMRRVTSDGRSRVSIDGRMASVGELARAIAPTIDLCGQHEHQQLMKTSQHVRMLDAWAGDAVVQARTAYEEAFATANAAAAELTRVREAGEASSAKLDEARFVLQRIDAVDPREGEYDELLDDLARVEHAEALAVAANGAHEALAGEQGAIDALGSAVAALDGAARYDAKLGEFADALRARRATTARAWSSTPRRWRSSKSAWLRCKGSCARTVRAWKTCWRVAPKRPTSYRSWTMPPSANARRSGSSTWPKRRSRRRRPRWPTRAPRPPRGSPKP